MIRRLLPAWPHLALALLLPGCCLQICITPCGGGCSPQPISCQSSCGQGTQPGPYLPGPTLPNTPFTKATLRNAKGSGKRIVNARVRGRDDKGATANPQFAPPPTGSYTNNYFDYAPLPMDPDDSPRDWTPGTSPAPQTVRNVEMTIEVELAPGSTVTYDLEITAPDGCAEPATGTLNKLRMVDVTFTGLDPSNNNGLFIVMRTYYKSDYQNGCGIGGADCITLPSSCSIVGH